MARTREHFEKGTHNRQIYTKPTVCNSQSSSFRSLRKYKAGVTNNRTMLLCCYP
jgi:hypothetical protein